MTGVSRKDLADMLNHARRMAETSDHPEHWVEQLRLLATDPDAAIKHLYGARWNDDLKSRVDPATMEAHARLFPGPLAVDEDVLAPDLLRKARSRERGMLAAEYTQEVTT